MTRDAFVAYVKDNQRAFRRFLVALCSGDAELADDIAQESYIKAYTTCDSFRDPSKFKSWIYRIGYNTFINHVRSRRFTVSCDEAAEMAAESRADDAFRYQALYGALDSLPDKERTAVLLFYLEGAQVKEIAQITGSGPDAVRQQLSRGRAHLRKLLEKD